MPAGSESSERRAPDPRFVGKPLPQSRFAGDAGEADPEVRAALAAAAAQPSQSAVMRVQHSLLGSRMLVPTAAGLDEADVDPDSGAVHEKVSHLAVATLTSPAGWTGLLAFTGVDAVAAWDPSARPVPVTAEEAAAAAVDDGRTVLVVDLAGPSRVALAGALLRALAAGRAWVPLHEDADVVALVAEIERRDPDLGALALVSPDVPDVDAVVLLTPGPDLESRAQRVAAALAEHPVVRDRADRGIGVGVRP